MVRVLIVEDERKLAQVLASALEAEHYDVVVAAGVEVMTRVPMGASMADGKFGPILGWLQEKVYRQGRRYRPADLVKRVTGETMKPDAFIAGMRRKFADIYGV